MIRCRCLIGIAAAMIVAGVFQAGFAQQPTPPKPGVVPAGTIVVHCPDAGCSLSLSGMAGSAQLPAGSGTVLSNVPGGEHTVVVRTAGTLRQARVTICGNRITVTATRSDLSTSGADCPSFGYLDLSVPKAADVTIAGQALPARGSQTIPIYVGTASFDVSLAGYQTYTATEDIKAGTAAHVTVPLQPLPGVASISDVRGVENLSVDGVDVIVHGKVQSTSLRASRNGPDLQVTLAPGEHVVKATEANHAPVDISRQLKSGAHVSWNLAFVPLPAKVTLKVWPPSARVILDGSPVDGGQPQVIKAGDHLVRASAPGFEPMTKHFTAAPNGKQEVDLTLVGKPVSVVLRGAPAGAKVRVDSGQPAGAFKPVTVAPGPHTIEVSAPGYATLTKKVAFSTTPVQVFDATLKKLSHIAVSVSPTSSTVAVDGKAVPVTAGRAAADVVAGTHSVTAGADSYASKTTTVDIEPGKTVHVSLTLSPVPAIARLVGLPAGASVTVDGRQMKVTGNTVAIPVPGKHSLVISSAAVVAKSFDVTTAPGANVTVDLGSFTSRPATITLSPAPPGTRILIDNQPVEAYSGPLVLAPGKHTLWVAAPGYNRARLSLDLTAGQKETIDPGLVPTGN